MSAVEFRRMMANVDAVWADEVLRERGWSLKPEQARILTLIATLGDKKAASKAWTEAAKREVFVDA